ncbi:MAG: bifunctional folylpolyglutamate synthase/dihydrofolate synthase [Ignavibacteriales bacterium]|nr:bifunctional folylpolyglutamate synthase/dihydrofolate synthase [Ignavibacteriales bacterium]
MNIDSALEKIYSLKQFHVKLGLDNIKKLLNHIGNPQEKLKIIHVAGSNGKGSTCSFLASILQEHGYKVGLYTSPHFVRFNERIRINGIEISDDEIIIFLDENKNFIEEESPTFFEIATAMAFQHFKKYKVDFAVIETGLGGRLDATNTIVPLASVITSISLEHTKILGNTIEKIAYEKGGIIKNKIPLFIGKLPKEAKVTLVKIAEEKKSIVIDITNHLTIIKNGFKLKLKKAEQKFKLKTLIGTHQNYNAALAIKTLNEIISKLDYNKIQNGLDNVINNSGLQGRFQKISESPKVIFDAAHNLEGVKVFIKLFKKEFKNYKTCTLIYGALNDKNNKQMLTLLQSYFIKVYVTSINNERSETTKNLISITKSLKMDASKTNYPEK